VRHYDGKVVPGHDPLGRPHFWFTIVPLEAPEEGTDRWAVEQGFASITPLGLDLTNHQELAAARKRHPRHEQQRAGDRHHPPATASARH
jgi:5'-nucleotidase